MAIKALIIGINEYLGIDDLSICINDAVDWEDLFKKTFNVKPSDIKTLTGISETTRSYILKSLKSLIEDLQPGDIGVFIFSGHGTYDVVEDPDGIWVEQQLRTRDLEISEVEIAKILMEVPIESKLISIIDTCFSGGFHFNKILMIHEKHIKKEFNHLSKVEIKTYQKDPILRIPPEAKFRDTLAQSSKSKSIYTFTASRKDELAYGGLIEGRRNSAFSRYLINEIKENKNLSYRELFALVYLRLPNIQLRFDQTPQLFTKESNNNNTIFN